MRHEQVIVGDIVRWASSMAFNEDGYVYAIVERTFYLPNTYEDEMTYEVRTFDTNDKFRLFRQHFQKVS